MNQPQNIYNSKANRLVETLYEDLAGAFRELVWLPSEQILAERYDVSRHTVRHMIRLLEERGALSRGENRRLRIERKELPSRVATAVVPKKRIISWLFAGYFDHNMNELIHGINDCLTERGHELRIINSMTGHETILEALRCCREYCGDGFLIEPYDTPEYRKALLTVAKNGFPAVMLCNEDPNIPLSTASSDDFGGLYQATMQLLIRYHEPVYMISNSDSLNSMVRQKAWSKAMEDMGYGKKVKNYLLQLGDDNAVPDHWPMDSKVEHLIEPLNRFFDRLQPPFNMVTICDYVAWAVYEVARQRNWVIGRDVRVIGFDDLPRSATLTPPLTSVGRDMRMLGYRACELLLQRIARNNSDRPMHIKVPCELIERESD